MKRFTRLKSFLLLCALIAGAGTAWADDTYSQVTDVDDLDTDATYIIADVSGTPSTARAMGALNNNNRGTVLSNGLSVSGSSIVVSSDAETKPLELTLTKSGDSYYTISYGSTFLGYSGSGTAFITTTTLPTGDNLKKYQWNIEYNDTYKCLLINNVNSTARYIIRNGTSGISAYSSGNLSSYGKSTLYKKEVSSDPSSNAAFANTTPAITYPATKTFAQAATTAAGYTGTVVYEITANTAGATLEGTTVTVTKGGTVTVQATAPAITGFSASTASYTLTVTDSRSEAGLAYADASHEVHVGEILSAPALTNPNSLAVTYESSDEDVATVDGSGNVTGVSKGTATITASFAGNETYKPGSASYTINVSKAIPAGALFYESMSGYTGNSDGSEISTSYANLDSEDWATLTKVFPGKVLSGDTEGHIKFGSSNTAGTAVTKSIALTGVGKLTYKVQRYDSSNAGNLKITVTGATASGDVDVTGTDKWVEKTVYLTGATGNVVITFATTSSNKRIRVDDILVVSDPDALKATVTDAGWATWVAPLDVEVPSEVSAYIVKVNGTKTELTELLTIPAGTPVLLKNAGTYEFPVASEILDDVSTNELKVSDGNGAENAYVLAKPAGHEIGFYKWTDTAALPAGKVYLTYTSPTAPSFISLDGETTGVNEVRSQMEDVIGEYYNLSGQRVAQPSKGLYIMNGKKVIVK